MLSELKAARKFSSAKIDKFSLMAIVLQGHNFLNVVS